MEKIISQLILITLLAVNYTSAQKDASSYIIPVKEEVYKTIVQFYQYDKNIPYTSNKVEIIETDVYLREKIIFQGINNIKVIGYLAIPKTGTAPYPCVLQMHGLAVSKSDFWEEEYHYGELVTQKLLDSGYAVLALDMPYHGDRIYENDFIPANTTLFKNRWGYHTRDMVVQSTIEYRRAIDYLETRTDIDKDKIGAIGYSLGSVITFNLTGIDDRVKCTVVCTTAIIKPRPFFPPKEHLSGIAPQSFIPYIKNTPVLILAAENDKFNCTVDEANALFELLQMDEKKIIFYDCNHKLPKEHAKDVFNWFVTHL